MVIGGRGRTSGTAVQELARFVERAAWDDLSAEAHDALKLRLLDSLGCAVGALGAGAEPIWALQGYLKEMGGEPSCTMIGGGRTAPDRAALFNGALIRYLDYNDSFLAPGETCHPSDNIGAVLAAAEHAGRSGAEFLTALAVAYQVQCRLSEAAPVRARGFDHTVQLMYGAAAGAAKALGLERERIANAIAIAGTAFNALRVTRTGTLSHWKGLAAPNAGFAAVHAAFLARHGITGPPEVFEGNKGFRDTIAGRFDLDWVGEELEAVSRTILKKYNAEIHSQSTLEGVLALRAEHGLRGGEVERVEVEIFDVAYHIIGGGMEGDKYVVATKEAADHSLPYMVAVALLDGWVGPAQYAVERIGAADAQRLLRRVVVRPDDEFSRRFPAEMPARVKIVLRDGRSYKTERRDYEGFFTRPMGWDSAREKFDRLSEDSLTVEERDALVETLRTLERRPVGDLTALLARVSSPGSRAAYA